MQKTDILERPANAPQPEKAVKCSRCRKKAVKIREGYHRLCAMHYRHSHMRWAAKCSDKAVPSFEQLEKLTKETNLYCMDCNVKMNWFAKDGGRVTTVTLQHYRDGTFGFVCQSCNSRHHAMSGDSYRSMPKDHKYCPKCKQIKPFSGFSKCNGRGVLVSLKSHCKACTAIAHKKWRHKNREYYNAFQRKAAAKRKALP